MKRKHPLLPPLAAVTLPASPAETNIVGKISSVALIQTAEQFRMPTASEYVVHENSGAAK